MKKSIIRSYIRKAGVVVVAAAVASSMGASAAWADTGNAKGNGYGVNPGNPIGTATVPSAANGDAPYNLTDLTQVDGTKLIVGGCGGSGTATCDYLDVMGVSNIGSIGYNWGTKINQSPNPFAWNDLMTEENNAGNVGNATSSSSAVGYEKAAWSGVMTYAAVIKYRPQVLATSTAGVDKYTTIIDAIHEADGNTDYNPTVITIAPTGGLGLTSISDMAWEVAAAVEDIEKADSTLTTRYGDVSQIAQNLEAYGKALQWYILSKHEKQGTLKTIAFVTGYDTSGKVTLTTTNPSTKSDIYSRNMEGFEQITYNICNTYTGSDLTLSKGDANSSTYTTTSLDCFKDVDVVFWNAGSGGPGGQGGAPGTGNPGQSATSDNQSMEDFQKALTAAGSSAKVCDLTSAGIAVGHQGFGLYRNLAEYMSYLYPEDVQLSYLLKYYWLHFGHVKDEYVDAVMADQDGKKLLPTGNKEVDLDTAGYSDAYVEDLFAQGEEYYLANWYNKNSYCSHYRLKANDTTANDDYTFGTYKRTTKPADTPAAQPAVQTITVKAGTVTKTLKAKNGKLAKKTTIKLATTFKPAAKTAVSYKLVSVSAKAKKYVSLKSGKVTVKKGLKKGTYKVKIKISAAGNASYKAATKSITLKLKIK